MPDWLGGGHLAERLWDLSPTGQVLRLLGVEQEDVFGTELRYYCNTEVLSGFMEGGYDAAVVSAYGVVDGVLEMPGEVLYGLGTSPASYLFTGELNVWDAIGFDPRYETGVGDIPFNHGMLFEGSDPALNVTRFTSRLSGQLLVSAAGSAPVAVARIGGNGKRAEKFVLAELNKRLARRDVAEVIGTQVSFRTAPVGMRRVVDILVRHKVSGRVYAIEVKSGTAVRSWIQRIKDRILYLDDKATRRMTGRRANEARDIIADEHTSVRTFEVHVERVRGWSP